MKRLPILFVAVAAGVSLSGCSRQETQKTLARRLSGADHSIVTNSRGWSMPLTAEDTKKVIHAISTARKMNDWPSCGGGLWIGFLKGTNSLGELNACAGCGQAFWIDHGPHPGGWRLLTYYEDRTGALKTVNTQGNQRWLESQFPQ